MRKFGLFTIFIMIILLSSCTSLPTDIERNARNIVHWDETMPKEGTVGLFINQGIRVTEYNGVAVNWNERTVVYLPPGTVTLIMDVAYNAGNRHINARGLPFQWSFNAGGRYYLIGWWEDNGAVIKIADPNDSTPWTDQASYRFPVRQGPIRLQ